MARSIPDVVLVVCGVVWRRCAEPARWGGPGHASRPSETTLTVRNFLQQLLARCGDQNVHTWSDLVADRGGRGAPSGPIDGRAARSARLVGTGLKKFVSLTRGVELLQQSKDARGRLGVVERHQIGSCAPHRSNTAIVSVLCPALSSC